MIRVARDTEGIFQAALQMFESGLIESARPKLRERNEQIAAGLEAPERTLAAIYYERVNYLLMLDAVAPGGMGGKILKEDFDGIEAVRAARRNFRAAHLPCPHCGALKLGGKDTLCWNCWKNYEEKK